MVMDRVATFQELLDSLPKEAKTKEVLERLMACYEAEVSLLHQYAGRAKRPSMALLPFTKSGRQYIADFWVNDLGLPKEGKYNWHLQNTSQWLYAGCILIQDGRVSTHH
jgi:hypothetical protein